MDKKLMALLPVLENLQEQIVDIKRYIKNLVQELQKVENKEENK